jgi:hypothetical protein
MERHFVTPSRQDLRPAPTREDSKAFALIQVLGAGVIRVDLEVDGATPVLLRDLQSALEQRATDTQSTMTRDDEELVEPGDESSVLEGPGVREDRDADRLRGAGEEDGAPGCVVEQPADRLGELVQAQLDVVLAELTREEVDDGGEVFFSGFVDAHDDHTCVSGRGFRS